MFSKTKEVIDHAVARKVYEIDFPYTDIDIIKSIEISCTCLEFKWDAVASKIKVTYTPDPVPKHILMDNKNCYEATKKLTIVFRSVSEPFLEQTAILLIEAKVYNN